MGIKYGLVGGWTALILAGWGFESAGHAGMIGSPVASVPARTLAVGVEGDVISRELSFATGPSPDIDMVKILFWGAYGVLDRVNLLLFVGRVDDDFRVENFDGSGAALKFLGDPTVSYGGGFKVTLQEFPLFRLGAGGRLELFTLDSRNSTTGTRSDASMIWREFLFFLGVHLTEVPYFVPYGGFYLTKLDGEINFSTRFETIDIEESQSIGLFYGGDFRIWRELVLGTELHLIAENSIAFSLRYSF